VTIHPDDEKEDYRDMQNQNNTQPTIVAISQLSSRLQKPASVSRRRDIRIAILQLNHQINQQKYSQ
jgi:hypothetical protein